MDFEEYIRQGEPDKKEKASIWQTAIGLQAVDGLKTSDYLKETARKHIEGDIDIDQARELIKTYYQSKSVREPDDDQKQEADKVSPISPKYFHRRHSTSVPTGLCLYIVEYSRECLNMLEKFAIIISPRKSGCLRAIP